MESSHELSAQESEIELFQKQVRDHFHDLSEVSADELLSIAWIRKLLDVLVCCQEEYRIMLVKNREWVPKPPLDRWVPEFFERSVKSLNICNATRNGIENVRLWQKHLEIVVCALDLARGHWVKARMFVTSPPPLGGHSRSLSWSVSRSWSAAKQLQSIANNLIPPRGNEIAATSGLAVPIFTMSFVLMFVLWVLVAAIPCQDRGLNTHFSIPRQFSWGTPLHSLHERILEVSRRREHRNSNGLLNEICQVERYARHMTDLVDTVQFPLTKEHEMEVEQGVQH